MRRTTFALALAVAVAACGCGSTGSNGEADGGSGLDANTFVCAGGDILVPHAQPSITRAVAAASPGQTVVVCPGTYSAETTSETFPITVNGVKLVSAAGPEATIVDPARGERAFMLSGDAASIEGFTIQNAETIAAPPDGAAVYVESGSPRIAGNWFLKNRADELGGAIFAPNSSKPVIEDNRFAENEASSGGAIAVRWTKATIRGNAFLKNKASGDGGALHIDQVDEAGHGVVVEGNTFDGNTSGSSGGAVHVLDEVPQGAAAGIATFARNVFRNNDAYDIGGAISLWVEDVAPFDIPAPEIVIDHNLFDANTAHRGAAINIEYGYASVSFNRFERNEPGIMGSGGVANISMYFAGNPVTAVTDNNFVGNLGYGAIGPCILGAADGHGNYFADNNGATGPDMTVCPIGALDFYTDWVSSSADPKQFFTVDACLSMANAPVPGAGP